MFTAVTRCKRQQRVKSACRIICIDSPENGGMAGPSLLWPFKRGATGPEVTFIIGVEAGKLLGCKILPEFPQTCPKSFCPTFAYKFWPTKIMKTSFWYNLQNKVSCVFMQTLGAIFLSQTTLGAISTRIFRAFAQIFRNQDFWGCACNPCPPPPTPLLFITVS